METGTGDGGVEDRTGDIGMVLGGIREDEGCETKGGEGTKRRKGFTVSRVEARLGDHTKCWQ